MEMKSTTSAIELHKIAKQIKQHTILKDINLTVPAGQIYGLSGPNGTGKSMLLRVICGLVKPTAGQVKVFGETIGKDTEFPEGTGAVINNPGFLSHYSGMRNLKLLAMIRDKITQEEIAEVIRQVGLDPNDRRPVRTYSTGMRQRLGIAQAIMEKPRLLLLDEPTSALDREGVQYVHTLLKNLREQGVTVLLTSHSQEELRTLCNEVYLIEHGQIERVAATG